MIKRYVETRREYPRLKTNIPAMASSKTGVNFPAIIRDLSPDGAQITYQGNKDTLLYDKRADLAVLKKLRVSLKFKLPYAENETVEIHTKPIHHHHLGDKVYVVGLVFDELDIEPKNKIMEYLTYETEPDFEDMKASYEIKNTGTSSHDKAEKALDHATRSNDDDKYAGNTDVNYDMKHELVKLNATLSSLISSVKTIEDKLDRLERKISK